jgi:formate hydrogenlyase subunit 3/multisubunit Na+/H+ antiporter MnhD subunit
VLLLLVALAVLAGGGTLSVLAPLGGRSKHLLGPASAVAGCSLGLAFAVDVLVGGGPRSLSVPWSLPGGSFHLQAGALSSIFLATTFGICGLAAVYGAGYFRGTPAGDPPAGLWFHFNALTLSMALVCVAGNAGVFVVAWEAMALASFFLVISERHEAGTLRAGWLYLAATHLGSLLVIAFFAALGANAGSLEFDVIAARGPPPEPLRSGLFLLAVAGFGAKAGFVPFHVWLPEAHPAAPSPVSAVMSGVMIKTGVYGILLVLPLLGAPPLWWGLLLVAVGASSGFLGVLYALCQHDLKRLLAYHSVENIGIIALGLGVSLVGISQGQPTVALLGGAGAVLHVVNHGAFKALLFFGAGAVAQRAGTREIDALGGLMRRMPWTGRTFAVGSAAIVGLPPLNGFVSEFLIFMAAFAGVISMGPGPAVVMAAAAASLALIGGLAAACFAKALGIVFLGEPRSAGAAAAREAGRAMIAPQVALAGVCVALGLAGPLVVPGLLSAVAPSLAGGPLDAAAAEAVAVSALWPISLSAALLAAVAGGLVLLRAFLQRGAPAAYGPTWDCGYALPTPRMEYTASSFASPLTDYFRWAARPHVDVEAPEGPFPQAAHWRSHTADAFLERWFTLLFLGVRRASARLLPLQNGRVQAYVLYVVVTLLVLLLAGGL